jgi:hypothetical protein
VLTLIQLGAIGIPDTSAVADEILVKVRVERDGEFAGEIESAVGYSVEFAGASAVEVRISEVHSESIVSGLAAQTSYDTVSSRSK